jgi:hypothetical protein
VSHKSLLKNVSLTQAGKAHSASHNKKYRFTKGEYRLTVKEDRDESHYPLEVAEVCITSSIKRLEEMLAEVRKLQNSTGVDV